MAPFASFAHNVLSPDQFAVQLMALTIQGTSAAPAVTGASGEGVDFFVLSFFFFLVVVGQPNPQGQWYIEQLHATHV